MGSSCGFQSQLGTNLLYAAALMSQYFNRSRNMITQVFLMTILVLASAMWSSADAQVPQGVGSGDRKDKSIEDKFRSDEMERVRRAGHTRGTPMVTRFPEIKEDFERIQVINSDVLQAFPSDAAVDYERLSAAAAEINKRATRLKSNLFPSELKARAEQGVQEAKEQQDLKSLLSELDATITRFVHNPMFENTRVVNPQDSERAKKELDNTIKLSDKIRKTAKTKKR